MSGKPPRVKQPMTHVTPSAHVCTGHAPQSAGQFVHVSKPRIGSMFSQIMFPQTEHVPQSIGQLAQSSRAAQRPSPQPVHAPQSPGHVKQFSMPAVHTWSPHDGQLPQSLGHVRQSSPSLARQKPSPHVGQ